MYMSFALLALLIPLSLLVVTVVVAYRVIQSQRRKAIAKGHASLGAYLRAVPVSDEDKKDAADLALKGLVICFLGLLFPPLLLIGLFPFFYGGRKVVYASMGLGLVDDADQPGA